jgi:F420-non-reducing hydrogenase iron-sulfur subunit
MEDGLKVANETNKLQSQDTASQTESYEPKIVAFLCRWCSYAGADLAGGSRIKYPANVRIIRVPCSCRIDPKLVLKTLERGVDGVLVSGCHPGDCHYTEGNYYARRRMLMLFKLLEFVGVDPRRVQMSWVSASEGPKWAEVVEAVTEDVKSLGPIRS